MINATCLDFDSQERCQPVTVELAARRFPCRVMGFCVVLGLCVITTFGQTTKSARVEGLLGSPDFKPTPDRPIGWRGDWTGRFPGATPPTEWSRRVKAVTTELKYQAGKPSGEPGPGAFPLEYFTLKEWLVAGPFSAEEPLKDIDKDFLNGEESVQPNEGDKAGDAVWKHLRAGIDTQSRHYHNEGTCGDLNVDFVYVFGNLPETGAAKDVEVPLNKKVAYAHTWVHAPSTANVMLRVNYVAAALKVFLNGKVVTVKRGEPVKVSLQKGWNRLLLKAASGEATAPEGQNAWVSRWRVAAYLEPVLPVSYETKNIAWMTKMTGRSMSQPIVVADRIYVGSGMTDLLCLDKRSGRILWLRSNTPYDAMSEEQRAKPDIKAQIEPLAAKLNALNEEAAKAINEAIPSGGLSSDRQILLDKSLKAKADAEKALHNALRSIDRKQYPPMYENEVSASNATPLSDGHFVYWACGGGMKGPGAHVVSCFELDGKRVWSKHDASIGSPEHGSHGSPNLADGKLIFAAKVNLLAYDAATGRELWRNSPNDWQNDLGNTSPLVTKIGNTSAVVAKRYIHRVSDGSVICPTRLDLWGVLTPVLEDGVLYNPCRWQGWKDPVSFLALKLPVTDSPNAKTETVLDLKGADVTMPTRQVGGLFTVASPLFADGIVYSVEMGGGLAAVDTRTGKGLFRSYLDGYNRYNRFLYGVAASPTLAGRHIYITDDAGYTHILERGPQLKETHRNVLENVHLSGVGGNPCKQECFYTSPFFEGTSMYLRGEEYLYCIRQ